MGDFLNSYEIFKKLGFDVSNQWIMYDERFQKFFSFLAEHITEDNILTEEEVLEYNEMIERGEFLQGAELEAELEVLGNKYPGIQHCTENRVKAIKQEVDLLKEQTNAYSVLLEEMREKKDKLITKVTEMEHKYKQLQDEEIVVTSNCKAKAKKLDELQHENTQLCNESTKRFINDYTPPLFIHQQSLDEYFQKCDSFIQHANLYMKETFKIQDDMELNSSNADTQELISQLENLEKSFQHYALGYIKQKAKVKSTQFLIDQLDSTKIHIVSLAEMERETKDLELVNEHHLKKEHETLISDLVAVVQQHTKQRVELVLYENTKQKLERAHKRHESDERLAGIVSDALTNAELLWTAMQLDLERVRNRFDNRQQLSAQAKGCLRRIKAMQSLTAAASIKASNSDLFVERIAEMLSQHLGNEQRTRGEMKTHLYEYEKFCRLQAYMLQNMLNKKHYTHALKKLGELEQFENTLRLIVYNGPVAKPLLECGLLMESIFNIKRRKLNFDKILRSLRYQLDQITQRMQNDKFWRYNQMLWIWFLSEPKRVLEAIDEVKLSASKMPPLTGVKTLSGIKRK